MHTYVHTCHHLYCSLLLHLSAHRYLSRSLSKVGTIVTFSYDGGEGEGGEGEGETIASLGIVSHDNPKQFFLP